jgi:hypothetical protein
VREAAAICALLGALIELLAALGGPQAAGAGLPDQLPPPMPTGPLLAGIAAAGISAVGGLRIAGGYRPRLWGLVLLATTAFGIVVVSPWTGWFTIAAFFVLLAGGVALLIRPRPAR